MPPRLPLKPEPVNSYADAMALCQILDDFSDFIEDVIEFYYRAGRMNTKARENYPDQTALLRLVDRIKQRFGESERDVRELRNAFRQAITDYEHVHGPVFYEKSKRVFEYHMEVAQPIDLKVKPFKFTRLENEDDFPY